MSDIDENALRRKAERRAGAKLGFYIHALVFVVVNGGLWLLNSWTSPGNNWAIWPLFGWGIGLAAHGLGVFAALGDFHERAVEAELKKLRERGR